MLNRLAPFSVAAALGFAALSGVAAAQPAAPQSYPLEVVELEQFEGGADYRASEQAVVSNLLRTLGAANPANPTEYRLQFVDVGQFAGGAAYQETQRQFLVSLLAADILPSGDASKPRLVSFDGDKRFLDVSRRLRVWRPAVEFQITVNAQGEATSCELTEKFRRAYVNQKLCEVLSKHHQFEPARDAATDQPVEGQYTSRLVYLDMREKQGK